MRWSAYRSPEALIRNVRNSLFLLLVGIAGCATVQQELDQAKASWAGATYDEVVTRWGPPARSATLSDGRQTHTWTSQEVSVRGGGPSVGVGVGFPFGGTVNPATCERTLTFKDGVLAEQSWVGDEGYCRHFKR